MVSVFDITHLYYCDTHGPFLIVFFFFLKKYFHMLCVWIAFSIQHEGDDLVSTSHILYSIRCGVSCGEISSWTAGVERLKCDYVGHTRETDEGCWSEKDKVKGGEWCSQVCCQCLCFCSFQTSLEMKDVSLLTPPLPLLPLLLLLHLLVIFYSSFQSLRIH